MATWRKSSYSGSGTQSDCVEVANLGPSVGIRDSKNPSLGHIALPLAAFAALTAEIKSGGLDHK